MDTVLSVKGLSKKYKKQMAVSSVDMTIARGDIYGFVGENGSGKTTVIRMITGLIVPYAGEFTLFGVSNESDDIGKARAKVGAIVESPSIYMHMSAYDNLKTQCDILGIKDEGKIRSILEEVGLSDLYEDKKKAGNYSLGMRQRLGIAMALLGEPEFLILDEPMNGLDPAGIVSIRELILKLNRERGITFLISSHILTELSLVANKYGIISKGCLLEEITAKELHNRCDKSTTITANDPQALGALIKDCVNNRVEYIPNGVRILGAVDLNKVLAPVLAAGIRVRSINCGESTFEDYYLSVIGGAK